MSRDKRELDYPVELETQFIMKMPTEPAKALRDLIKSGENFKNRLVIQLSDDMRNGEVRFDHWLLHAKSVDLPTIVESWKSIDRKSLYKTADICQILICKEEIDPHTEEESPAKNKKKDPHKVDKKYLWPHGITPPTKNVRKRRFRKTLRKKCPEAPEIEKELKRLLRADNEAVSISWEVIKEKTTIASKNETITSNEKFQFKREIKSSTTTNPASKVEDIFGGALSDSDVEDDNVHVDIEDSRLSLYNGHLSDTNSILGVEAPIHNFATEFNSEMFDSSMKIASQKSSTLIASNTSSHYLTDNYRQVVNSSGPITTTLEQLKSDLEELKQRRQRTQLEIAGMENMALRQRFQDIFKTLNKEIITKEIEFQNLKSYLK
ncbi:transcription initiation factor TFIID subunit 7-like [Maniola jurtina]|uniref:transcription initiation factor TFIID subunit 7-like n=1 Tax=Maniola jurtina TaxID=191418 RepID=UPI001E689D91|nr:transcription initiation factor TFIID subunit 7-like [Maniola jurtina]XP_045768823.1 transcription initiation factor TFIID subunit 7-like [Maniola jurtina]